MTFISSYCNEFIKLYDNKKSSWSKIELVVSDNWLAVTSDFIMKFVVPVFGIISVQAFVQGYMGCWIKNLTLGLFMSFLWIPDFTICLVKIDFITCWREVVNTFSASSNPTHWRTCQPSLNLWLRAVQLIFFDIGEILQCRSPSPALETDSKPQCSILTGILTPLAEKDSHESVDGFVDPEHFWQVRPYDSRDARFSFLSTWAISILESISAFQPSISLTEYSYQELRRVLHNLRLSDLHLTDVLLFKMPNSALILVLSAKSPSMIASLCCNSSSKVAFVISSSSITFS